MSLLWQINLITYKILLYDDFPCLPIAHADNIDTLLEPVSPVAAQRVDADDGGWLMTELCFDVSTAQS